MEYSKEEVINIINAVVSICKGSSESYQRAIKTVPEELIPEIKLAILSAEYSRDNSR